MGTSRKGPRLYIAVAPGLTSDILIHSADYDAAGLDLLGINVEEIQSDLMNFANSSSNGSKFWIVSMSCDIADIRRTPPASSARSSTGCLATRPAPTTSPLAASRTS